MSSRLKVFLVEDEAMIRMMVADMLEAGQLTLALELARTTEFDLAILDVNLKDQLISPVAELIEARALPFIFATGYGTAGLPEEFRDRPALQKPFEIKALAATIEGILKAESM
jgi:DNA-binding response OmpR family regulator